MTLELFCQSAGMVRKFLVVQTIDHQWHKPGICGRSPSPLRALTPACGSPNKACTPWCREDPPFTMVGSQHWRLSPHGSHTGLDREAKGLQGLLFLGKHKRYGSRIALHAISWESVIGIQDMPAGRGSQGPTPLFRGA